MMEVEVAQLFDLPADALSSLVVESERDAWRFVRRLADEWASGANRFDGAGEALLAARVDRALVGVCGLNLDPYAGDETIGRVRRLYVLEACRGRGVGRLLVQAVIRFAWPRFRVLRARTENPAAGRLFQRLEFTPVLGVPKCTHKLLMSQTSEPVAGHFVSTARDSVRARL